MSNQRSSKRPGMGAECLHSAPKAKHRGLFFGPPLPKLCWTTWTCCPISSPAQHFLGKGSSKGLGKGMAHHLGKGEACAVQSPWKRTSPKPWKRQQLRNLGKVKCFTNLCMDEFNDVQLARISCNNNIIYHNIYIYNL